VIEVALKCSVNGGPTVLVSTRLYRDSVIFYRNTDMSLEEVLNDHLRSIPGLSTGGEDANHNHINVRRKHIWGDTLRTLLKPSFNPLNPIRVTFITEAAVDLGGPRREFFSLGLLRAAKDPGIFCGPINAKLFVHTVICKD